MRKSQETSKTEIKVDSNELKAILEEYKYNPDVMSEEDERVIKCKKALGKIPIPDRTIFCLYLDLGASRKVGKLLGVSHSTILKEINRIKKEIRYFIMIDDE